MAYCYFSHVSNFLIDCVANVCLSDQVPLDCLAEDPSTGPAAAATDDAVYRCAKCRFIRH